MVKAMFRIYSILPRNKKVRFVGVIEPFIDKSGQCEYLQSKNIPIYESLEQFYKQDFADIVILATPIHLHCLQSQFVMNNWQSCSM